MPLFAFIDPYILAFSALTVLLTIALGFWSARRSRTAHDFFVAGRSVSVGWNASAISSPSKPTLPPDLNKIFGAALVGQPQPSLLGKRSRLAQPAMTP